MDSLNHEFMNPTTAKESIEQEEGLVLSATLVDTKTFSRSYSDLTYLEPATVRRNLAIHLNN